MSESEKKPTFQERLQALEALVDELESGRLDLEDAIDRFEAGRRLHQDLLADLARFEKRLEKLVAGPDGDRVEALPAGEVDRDAPGRGTR